MASIRFIIVMGVSGSGKTTIGKSLALKLGWDFYDADDFHPPENISKMAGGIPLNDSDRAPWLAGLNELILSRLRQNHRGVLACSALKERYRQALLANTEDVQLIYLKGSYDLIQSRMTAREDHFMKQHLLQSQFETLEQPVNALVVDISPSIDKIVRMILHRLE